jgi:hypothetical protein
MNIGEVSLQTVFTREMFGATLKGTREAGRIGDMPR